MSRWLSPQKAARLAERTAKEAQRKRSEKLKTGLLLAGLAVLILVTFVAWAYVQARLRHSRHRHRDRKPSSQSGTNRVELSAPGGARRFAKVEFKTRHDGR